MVLIVWSLASLAKLYCNIFCGLTVDLFSSFVIFLFNLSIINLSCNLYSLIVRSSFQCSSLSYLTKCTAD